LTVFVYIVYSLICPFICNFSVYVLCTVSLRNKDYYYYYSYINSNSWQFKYYKIVFIFLIHVDNLDVPVTIICFLVVYGETLDILHFSQANSFYFQYRHLQFLCMIMILCFLLKKITSENKMKFMQFCVFFFKWILYLIVCTWKKFLIVLRYI
jgi:hypothetical protein